MKNEPNKLDELLVYLENSVMLRDFTEDREAAKSGRAKKRVTTQEDGHEIAQILAPQLRTMRKRNVKIVSAKTGEVIREADIAEVARNMSALVALEFGTADEVRPAKATCRTCTRIFSIPHDGRLRRDCDRCRTGSCMTCGKLVRSVSVVRYRRQGKSIKCSEHMVNARKAMSLCDTCGVEIKPATAYTQAKAHRPTRCRSCAILLKRLPCVVCGRPSTEASDYGYRKGRAAAPRCEAHFKKAERLPCAVCSAPSTENSTRAAKYKGLKPYCAEHPRGRSKTK